MRAHIPLLLLLLGCQPGAVEPRADAPDEISTDDVARKKPKKPKPPKPPKPPAPPPLVSCTGQTEPVLAVASSPFTATTASAVNDTPATCGWASETAPDVELQLELPDLLTFRAEVTPGGFFVDSSLNLGRCDGGFPGWGSCNSNVSYGHSGWALNHVPAGTYYLVTYISTIDPVEPFELTVNGVIQPNGRCDVPLAVSGALVCAPGTACDGTACVSVSGECGDGVDNDGDGKNGYPFDPGCSSITDPTEADDCPSGPGCAACANQIDEDGDGFAGYPTDPGCKSPGDLDESDECASNPLNCPECSNGYDDDYDDRYDMDDPSCGFAGWNDEYPEY